MLTSLPALRPDRLLSRASPWTSSETLASLLPCQDGPASIGGSHLNVPSCNPSSPPNSTHKQGVHLQLWETEDSHAPVVPVVPSLPWLSVPGSCGSALTCSSRGHFPPLFSHLSRPPAHSSPPPLPSSYLSHPPAHSSPPTSQGNGGCQWNSLDFEASFQHPHLHPPATRSGGPSVPSYPIF